MSCLRQLRQIALFSAFAVMAGCSQPAPFGGADRDGKAEATKPPFRQGNHPESATAQSQDNQTAASDGGAGAPRSSGAARPPFGSTHDLAAGTLLAVHLEKPIYLTGVTTTNFTALVDEPIVVEGNTVVPQGAGVHGTVEAGRALNGEGNAGYVRLILDSVTIGDTEVPILTSSLFARGSPVGTGNPSSRYIGSDPIPARPPTLAYLRKGRRLTFRLSAPVSVRTAPAGTDHLSLLNAR